MRNARMPKKLAADFEVSCRAVNRLCLGAPERMRPVAPWIKPDHPSPLHHEVVIPAAGEGEQAPVLLRLDRGRKPGDVGLDCGARRLGQHACHKIAGLLLLDLEFLDNLPLEHEHVVGEREKIHRAQHRVDRESHERVFAAVAKGVFRLQERSQHLDLMRAEGNLLAAWVLWLGALHPILAARKPRHSCRGGSAALSLLFDVLTDNAREQRVA